MDPIDTKVSEHMFMISGLLGVMQSFVNCFLILYRESDGKMNRSSASFRDFVVSVYAKKTPPTTEGKKSETQKILPKEQTRKKMLSEKDAHKLLGFIGDVPLLCGELVNETLSIATHGDICDDILEKIESSLSPVHSIVQYHSRSGGYGSNTRCAQKETMPRSVFVTREDIMDITAGSMNTVDGGLSPSHKWAIDHALQLQSLDTCISQMVPSFTWSEKYFVDDMKLSTAMKDTRPWPRVSKNGSKKVESVRHLTSNPDREYSQKYVSDLSIRGEEGEYCSISVIRLGCMFITRGYGHSFCTPSLIEAFCAWASLKDAYETWDVSFYVSYIAEDKTQKRRLTVCNLENAVKHILHRRFTDESVFRKEVDEDTLKKLKRRVDSGSRVGKGALTEEDLM
jgi:hypothetical protein